MSTAKVETSYKERTLLGSKTPLNSTSCGYLLTVRSKFLIQNEQYALWTRSGENCLLFFAEEFFLLTKSICFLKDNSCRNSYIWVQVLLTGKDLLKYTCEAQADVELVEVWIGGSRCVGTFLSLMVCKLEETSWANIFIGLRFSSKASVTAAGR